MLPMSVSIELALLLFVLTVPVVLMLMYAFGPVLLRVFSRSFLLTLPAFGILGLIAWLILFCRELTPSSVIGLWTVFVVCVAIGSTGEIARPGCGPLPQSERANEKRRTTSTSGTTCGEMSAPAPADEDVSVCNEFVLPDANRMSL